ncbi:DUF3833 family protein [Sphingomonas jaspsi]|uniref:DUF3833 family protein n=1 Tax=Sphingomonas jaspsi TaxID=392409 RepID=UPI0004BC2D42|nr:DUF3833 family protein [Sphingomonas jaspsi]
MSLLLALALAAAPAAAGFDPVEFFRGRTKGDGKLKVIFQATKSINVESVGTAGPDGTLVLKQIVAEQGKPPRTRFWQLRNEGAGRYSGTLTDAVGPVKIETVKGRIHIRYRSKDHLDFEQWLTPAGPKQVENRMRVKRFGVTVAHVSETITKLD